MPTPTETSSHRPLIALLTAIGLVWLLAFYLPLRRERQAIHDFVERGREVVVLADVSRIPEILAKEVAFRGEHEQATLTSAKMTERAQEFFRHTRMTKLEILKETIDIVAGATTAGVRLKVRAKITDSTLNVEGSEDLNVTLELVRTNPGSAWAVQAMAVKALRPGGGDENG